MKKIVSGKVREVYEISPSELVITTSDRVSAFDVVMPKPVPEKGRLLNDIALFWFDYTKDIIPNHIISSDLSSMPPFFQKPEYEGRALKVKKLQILPYEIIVRGYIFGNMWKAYQAGEDFCGQKITGDFEQAQKLPTPILTPSTKASKGHDEYISFDAMAEDIGIDRAKEIETISLQLYETCYNYAYSKGIIIADTKFEFGLDEEGNLVLADEIFTPDSSRYWDLAQYQVGSSPKSYDKQLLRDWLENNQVNGQMQFDLVPDEILAETAFTYRQCLSKLTA